MIIKPTENWTAEFGFYMCVWKQKGVIGFGVTPYMALLDCLDVLQWCK